jgi:hypothetical protein
MYRVADVLKLGSAVPEVPTLPKGKIMRNPFRRRPRFDLAAAGLAASRTLT